MKNLHKGFVRTLFMLVIVIIALGAFIYYSIQKQRTNGQEQALTKIESESKEQEKIATSTVYKEQAKPEYEININKNENLPARLLILNDAISIINKDGTVDKLVDGGEEQLYGPKWSPDGKYIVYLRGNEARDGYSSHFGYLKAGISIVEAKPKGKIFDFLPPGVHGYNDINWSPDSKYISYVVDEAKSIEIKEIRNSVTVVTIPSARMKSYEATGASALKWISDTEFGYFLDGKIYIGTIANPKAKVIATDAHNDLCTWESAYYVDSPEWSADGRYVAYESKDNLIILDILTKKNIKIGKMEKVEEEYCSGAYLNISRRGWTTNNEYYYFEGDIHKHDGEIKIDLKSIALPNFTITNHDISISAYYMVGISPDGKYIIDTHGYSYLQNAKTGKQACEGIKIGSPVAGYVATSGYEEASWPKNLPSLYLSEPVEEENKASRDQNKGNMIIVDLNQCKVIAEVSTYKPGTSRERGWSYGIFDPSK